jgi:hypothetical protein
MHSFDYKYYQLIENVTGKKATIAVVHCSTCNVQLVRRGTKNSVVGLDQVYG